MRVRKSMGYHQKTVLITGCTPGGIGNALARVFHTYGLRVFATARTLEAISDLEELGMETLALDVTDDASIVAARDLIDRQCNGKLDFLINNAGRDYTIPATDIDLDQVKDTFAVNVFGIMRMCQVFVPLLIESKGTIVQLGSIAAVIPHVFGSIYNASKAALHSYSDTLRVELKPFNVNVLTLVTGAVKTNMQRIERTLPADSMYLAVADSYAQRQQGHKLGMSTDHFAGKVVKKVLKKGHGRRQLWKGKYVWYVQLLKAFFPNWVLEWMISYMYALIRLKGVPIIKRQWQEQAIKLRDDDL